MAKIKTHRYLKKKTLLMRSDLTSIIKTAFAWIAIITIVSICVSKIPLINKVMIKSLPVDIEIEAAGEPQSVQKRDTPTNTAFTPALTRYQVYYCGESKHLLIINKSARGPKVRSTLIRFAQSKKFQQEQLKKNCRKSFKPRQ